MLYIGKAKDPFTEEVLQYKLSAANAHDAQIRLYDAMLKDNPFRCYATFEFWAEPAGEDDKTFAVFCRNAAHPEINREYYPDSFEEATGISDAMSAFYDDIEICFGWEGCWTHYDQDDVGMRLYSQFYMEAV